MKHTKKQWALSEGHDETGFYEFVVHDDNGIICKGDNELLSANVNAHLIVAAPDLLEACHAAVEVLECNCSGKCEGSCTKGIVAAAITKAESKAPAI